jgi:PAS domain-containing protein
MVAVSGSTAFSLYAGAYAVATIGCILALGRATRVQDNDTRRGLVGLLLGSGGWAALELGFLVAPDGLKYGFYLASLVVGLTTVGAWLYFCSAYTGRSFHRDASYRHLAAAVYLAIVVVKVTNPYHGLYFTTAPVTEPFPHVTIMHQTFHWVVTGLAYALSAIGFYLLFETFRGSNYATGRLSLLVALAGLPVVFDVIAYSGLGPVITLNYEPVGVALFAVGVLYVADGSFVAVRRFGREQLLDQLDEAVVIVDTDWRIKDTNEAARELFPSLADSLDAALVDVVPELDDLLPVEDSRVIEFADDGVDRVELPQLLVLLLPFRFALADLDLALDARER